MQKKLQSIIRNFSGRRILIVGDLIADEFLYGQVSRISREAPVLVLESRHLVRLPGGAANTANNILALGAAATVAGITGRDEPGKGVLETLKAKGADTRLIRRVAGYTTPVKTRILAGAPHAAPHQIVRVDRCGEFKPSPRLASAALREAVREADGVILSDYGYNTVKESTKRELIRMAAAKGIPILADSRFSMADYSGVTGITPNITELEAAEGVAIGSDRKLLDEVATQVLIRQRLGCLLVTQGKHGMTLFEPGKRPLRIPVFGTDEVADVTGAGDTVIAVFALALSAGALPEHAAYLANFAGGIVVMKQGTATVSRPELRAALK